MRRSPTGCTRMIKNPDFKDVKKYPLATNHCIGTLEQYLSRNYTRRDPKIWAKKAQLNGDMDDGWIRGWPQSFVEEHGLEKVSRVLRDYQTE
jgi:hypothetical protein